MNIKQIAQRLKPNKPKGFSKFAAVLVPLCYVDQVPSILFTKRSNTLRSHTGQISFPGGIQDPSDNNSDTCTALREAREEIGAKNVQILGSYASLPAKEAGLLVTPVVGYLGEVKIQDFKVNPAEVEKIIIVPLQALMKPSGFDQFNYKGNGSVSVPYWNIEGNRIWGLTALFVWNLLKIVYPKAKL
jgi:nudix motif 8